MDGEEKDLFNFEMVFTFLFQTMNDSKHKWGNIIFSGLVFVFKMETTVIISYCLVCSPPSFSKAGCVCTEALRMLVKKKYTSHICCIHFKVV